MNVNTIRPWIAGSVALGIGLSGAMTAVAASLQSIAGSASAETRHERTPGLVSSLVAQQADTCRRAAYQVGIYQEPNLTSTAVGVLEEGDYLRIGTGSGGGWVRITAPAVGWVEARNLLGNDSTPCPAGLEAPPTQTPALPPANQPPATTPPAIVEEPTTPDELVTRTAVCRVTPAEGLVVRSRPLLITATAVGTIPSGVQTFEFSDRTVTTETTEGTRQWVYIVSPVEGWISPGFVGSNANLVGAGCTFS